MGGADMTRIAGSNGASAPRPRRRPVTPAKAPKTPAQVFTYEEAADVLSISVTSVKRLVYAKRLRAKHIGRAVRIPQTAVEEYLNSTAS